MTVSCQITHAEMREAFRMNLTPSFWWKSALGNVRAVIYLGALIAVVITQFVHKGPVDWKLIGFMLALVIFIFAMFFLRVNMTIRKQVKAISAACNQMTIDGQGISAEGTNGARTFVPWSALNRWKEGKLVFTAGDGKTFRTFSKQALGEMQSGELRSLLQSNIR